PVVAPPVRDQLEILRPRPEPDFLGEFPNGGRAVDRLVGLARLRCGVAVAFAVASRASRAPRGDGAGGDQDAALVVLGDDSDGFAVAHVRAVLVGAAGPLPQVRPALLDLVPAALGGGAGHAEHVGDLAVRGLVVDAQTVQGPGADCLGTA